MAGWLNTRTLQRQRTKARTDTKDKIQKQRKNAFNRKLLTFLICNKHDIFNLRSHYGAFSLDKISVLCYISKSAFKLVQRNRQGKQIMKLKTMILRTLNPHTTCGFFCNSKLRTGAISISAGCGAGCTLEVVLCQ